MKISVLKDNVNAEVKNVKDMEELSELIVSQKIHAWSPAIFKNNYRSLSNFVSMELIALDVDEGLGLEAAGVVFSSYEHLIAPTRNHQKAKELSNGKIKPPADRFRIILRLDSPITSQDDYYATYQELRKKWPFIDPVCNNADRMFYPCLSVAYGENVGTPIIPTKAPAKPVEPKRDPLPPELRGNPSKATLEFISLGVKTDRNRRAFKAAKDLQEQGYDQQEAEELLLKCPTLGEPGFEERDLMKAIKQAYKKEPKYEPRGAIPNEGRASESTDSVQANEGRENSIEVSANTKSLESLSLLEEALAHLANPEAVKGISTGWKEVDELLGGLRQSELGIIQAYPKSGKTVLLTNLMVNLTAQGHKVGFASLEMHPAKQVEPDLYCLLLNKNIREGVSDADKLNLERQLKAGRGLTYFKRDRRPTAEEICEWIRSCYFNSGIRFIFVDHFHKFVTDESSTAAISRTITALTGIKYECPELFIGLVVQPTKEQRGRDNLAERVGKNTLRGGASIFDECDWLVNIHTKFSSERIHETTWGEKRERLMLSYPNDIRELEFEAIRAKPYSENMGKKIHMKYDKGTTRMAPHIWVPPRPERIEQPEREDNGYNRRPQQTGPRPQSGWARDTWRNKKI